MRLNRQGFSLKRSTHNKVNSTSYAADKCGVTDKTILQKDKSDELIVHTYIAIINNTADVLTKLP